MILYIHVITELYWFHYLPRQVVLESSQVNQSEIGEQSLAVCTAKSWTHWQGYWCSWGGFEVPLLILQPCLGGAFAHIQSNASWNVTRESSISTNISVAGCKWITVLAKQDLKSRNLRQELSTYKQTWYTLGEFCSWDNFVAVSLVRILYSCNWSIQLCFMQSINVALCVHVQVHTCMP